MMICNCVLLQSMVTVAISDKHSRNNYERDDGYRKSLEHAYLLLILENKIYFYDQQKIL